MNTVVALPAPTPEKAIMPFMDPAFASAVCRYDLSQGPLKLRVPVSPAYTSVSFYTRNDVAYYAINDRAAGRRVIELDLMTTAQHDQVPEDEEITAADRLIVELPTRHRGHRDPGDGAGAGPDAGRAGCHCRRTLRHGAARTATPHAAATTATAAKTVGRDAGCAPGCCSHPREGLSGVIAGLDPAIHEAMHQAHK